MHPPDGDYSAVRYRLGKQAAGLKAAVALDDTSNFNHNPALFEVLGDGKVLWQSAPVRKSKQPQECSVGVTGVDVLELRVHAQGSHFGLHAVWIEPRILQKADTPDETPPLVLFKRVPRDYLADLEAFYVKVGPWPFSRDGTVGDGKSAIQVDGVLSPKGLAMHPPDKDYSAVKYRLAKKAAVLKATVALNDTASFVRSPAVFEVLGDSKRLWQSTPVSQPRRPQECSVSVAGVDVLELRVYAQGSHMGLHAVWIEPRLLQQADTPDQ